MEDISPLFIDRRSRLAEVVRGLTARCCSFAMVLRPFALIAVAFRRRWSGALAVTITLT